jgi:putative DNA primase/helicase
MVVVGTNPAGKNHAPGGGSGLWEIHVHAEHRGDGEHGRHFPDGEKCEPTNVLLISDEDGLADTIRPRLDAASADPARIHHFKIRRGDQQETFDIGAHLEQLRQKVNELDVGLIIIDPLSAYLGDVDTNKDARVRTVLTPLASLAEESRVAIVAIMHLNKAPTLDIIYRVTGSVAFVAQARAAWAIVEDPQTPGRRLFLLLKPSLVRADKPGLAFRIIEDNERRAKIEWEADPVTIRLRDVVGGFSNQRNSRHPRGPKPAKRENAKALLRESLADGEPHESNSLIEKAKAIGISFRTLKNAAKELGVNIKKAGFAGGWTWRLNPMLSDLEIDLDAAESGTGLERQVTSQ